jgi:choline dehydrogenase-like flavoprotein
MTEAVATFDHIVIGAGTAGCLLANRLGADPAGACCCWRPGGATTTIWIHIPVGYLYCIGNPRTDWLYRTEPEPGLNGRRLRYPRGKVLGGCSSINGMIYMRGQSRDYDHWAEVTGDDGWRWEPCLPVLPPARGPLARAPCAAARRRRRVARRAPAPVAGSCSTPSRRRRSRPASRPPTTSTAATTTAWATSR